MLSPDRQPVLVPGGVADLRTGEVTCTGTYEDEFLAASAVGDGGTVVGVLFGDPSADASGTFVLRDGEPDADREIGWAQFGGILGDSVIVVGDGVLTAHPIR